MDTIQTGDRYGVTIPVPGIPLADQRDLVAGLPDLGYTDVWTGEADGPDAFTPLVLASQWAPELRLGTAIVPAFTRGPAVSPSRRRRWPPPAAGASSSVSARRRT